MLDFLVNSINYKHLACIATLAICLGSCEQPQAVPVLTATAPTSQLQPDRYYLNAQVSTKEVVEQLDPKTIVRVDVLKGQQAADYARSASIKGVVLVQTK